MQMTECPVTSLDENEVTKIKSATCFILLEPEQDKQVQRMNGWLIPPIPPREKWVFSRIIEFSAVNNSNMPFTLALL